MTTECGRENLELLKSCADRDLAFAKAFMETHAGLDPFSQSMAKVEKFMDGVRLLRAALESAREEGRMEGNEAV